MSERRALSTGKLLRLVALAMLMQAMRIIAGTRPSRAMPVQPVSPSPSPSGLHADVMTYSVGYGFALMLTLLAFALAHWQVVPLPTTLWLVFGLALVQMIVHFRCFLHVSRQGPARDDLQLILFSTVIVLLMVGGTLVILFNLRMRMM